MSHQHESRSFKNGQYTARSNVYLSLPVGPERMKSSSKNIHVKGCTSDSISHFCNMLNVFHSCFSGELVCSFFLMLLPILSNLQSILSHNHLLNIFKWPITKKGPSLDSKDPVLQRYSMKSYKTCLKHINTSQVRGNRVRNCRRAPFKLRCRMGLVQSNQMLD